jgi:hypothetical protein
MYLKHGLLMFMCFVAAAVLTSVVLAQNQGGSQSANMPMSAGGGMNAGIGVGPMGYISLLNNDKVLKALDLTDQQQAKVAAAVGEAANAVSGDMKNSFRAPPRGINPQEHGNLVSKIMKNSQDKLLKKLDKILQPEQISRLKQIHMQADGSMALFDPEVVKALKITPEQQDKMTALLDDFQNAMIQKSTGYQTPNSGGGMAKIDGNMTKELGKQLNDVLTEDQRAEFEKLKGPKADLGHSSFKMKNSSKDESGSGGGGN